MEKLQQKAPVVYVQNVYWVVMLGMSLSTSTQCLVEQNWYFLHNIFGGFQTFKPANRSTLAIAGNFSTEKGFVYSHSDIPILQ